MKDIIKMTFDDTVYELYQAGWITKDLYLKGGVSFDACNNITVNKQIDNYRSLKKKSFEDNDDYTEALLNIADDQLTILGRIKALLITLNN